MGNRKRKLKVIVRTEIQVEVEVDIHSTILDESTWVGLHQDEIIKKSAPAMKKEFEKIWMENAYTEV